MNYHILWFGLLGVLLFGYAVLDGFDLGVGILYPFAKTDRERRILLNSIGPLWDGNEVWLVTFGGALFACFPNAYATIFSGFYLPFMLLLTALIFRAVSIEVRGKIASTRWKGFFDTTFAGASIVAALLYGVAIGNVLTGVPVRADGEFPGRLLELLRPYPILVGLTVVALFAMHGAIYLYLKTEGELKDQIKGWMWTTFGCFMVSYILVTMYTLAAQPQMLRNFQNIPLAWAVPVLNVLAVANIPRAIYLERPFYAFASSCCSIAALVFLLGMALFPNLLPSSLDPKYSLDIYNAAASQKTLSTAALIALMGMPMVLTYTGIVYWVFRGKVKLGEFSY
jgi:cytochrome d ubiquinol oxidase subunit II